MDAYRSLYESSIAFGIRKSLSAEHNKLDMQDRLTELEVEKQKIKDDLATAVAKYEMAQRQGTEQRIAEQQRHNEEINFLKRSNQQLKAQLEGIIAPKKWFQQKGPPLGGGIICSKRVGFVDVRNCRLMYGRER